jgi:hypothetical protein
MCGYEEHVSPAEALQRLTLLITRDRDLDRGVDFPPPAQQPPGVIRMFDPNAMPPHGQIPSGHHEGLALRCVEPDAVGGWKITAPGSRRASGVCATQAEAIWRATQIVANAGGGTVRIHEAGGGCHDRSVLAAHAIGRAGKTYRQPRMTIY